MSIQPTQLLVMMMYAAICYGSVRLLISKKYKLGGLLIFIGFILFVANPLRFKQNNISRLESNINRFEIVERVVVKQDSFENKQAAEMQKLKTQSEILKNEIHD